VGDIGDIRRALDRGGAIGGRGVDLPGRPLSPGLSAIEPHPRPVFGGRHQLALPPAGGGRAGAGARRCPAVGRLHASEKRQPSTKVGKVQFNIVWAIPDEETKTIAIGPVNIPEKKSPKETALLIQSAIGSKIKDANATVSENPPQTNATGSSCDIIFAPPRGRMTIDKLQWADDDQPIHVIRIDLSKDLVVSNFPESYHIASPQMRCLLKSYTWGPEEQIKVIFASPTTLKVASGGDAVAMGLGALRDYPKSTPLPSIRNSIIASRDATSNKMFISHELGHVLIDTGAHAYSDDEVMRAMPLKQSTRFIAKLPSAPNWEYFSATTENPTPDFISGVTRYNKVALNAVARMQKAEGAMGTPVKPPTPKPFTPLQEATRTALKTKMQELLTKVLGSRAPQVATITPNGNYIPVRDVKLYAWDKYRAAYEQNNTDWTGPITSALTEAAQVGSAKIKQILSDFAKEPDKTKLARILLGTTDAEFWDGFVVQCPSAPSLVTASLPLAGFRGQVLGNPAIFIGIEDFGQDGKVEPTGQVTQPGPDIRRHCYTVMHEFMHFYAVQGKGFQHTSVPTPKGASGTWQTMLDEGATELFTRLLLYRSDKDTSFKNMAEHPDIPYFGLDSKYLPVYEVAKNIVAQMAKDVGLNLLANAYFLGEFPAFFNALASFTDGSNSRYGDEFWAALGNLEYTARPYLNPNSPQNQTLNTIIGLRTNGIDQSASPTLILRPADVIAAWTANTYDDPAKQLVNAVT